MRYVLFFLFISVTGFSRLSPADSIILRSQSLKSDSLKADFLLEQGLKVGGTDFELSIRLYEAALAVLKTKKPSVLLGRIYHAMGRANYFRGTYDKALKNYLSALQIFEQVGNKTWMAETLNALGVFKKKRKLYADAEKHFNQALALYLETGDSSKVAISINNLGNILEEQFLFRDAIVKYDQAVEIEKAYNDSVGLSYSYDFLSSCYANLGQFRKAVRYLEDALKIRMIKKDEFAVTINLNNLGEIYFMQKDYKKAVPYFRESMVRSEKAGYRDLQAHTLSMLSSCAVEQGDYKTALELYKRHKVLKDSILNETSVRQLAEIQTEYETELKDKENLELRQENTEQQLDLNRRTLWLTIVSGGSLILILSAFLVYSRIRSVQKSKLGAERLQQERLRTKAVLETEELERSRIARELHDGVGQLLSAVKLNLAQMNHNKGPSKELQKAIDLVDESVREVRNVSHIMMPLALQRSGIETAVREFLSKIPENEIAVSFSSTGMENRLEPAMESALYRIIQEAVQNILKHSGATKAGIQLVKHDSEVVLIVEDNGKGFNAAETRENGVGLKNILSRVEYFNGNVNFDSQPGKGTTLVVEIPTIRES